MNSVKNKFFTLFLPLLCSTCTLTSCRVYSLDASVHTVTDGAGSCTDSYLIYLRTRSEIRVDSVISMADHTTIIGEFNNIYKGNERLADFLIKFSVLRDKDPKGLFGNMNNDLSRGVIIYYHLHSRNKKGKLRIRHFDVVENIT